MNTESIFIQFEELYKLKKLDGCYNPFIKDGIIDYSRFSSQNFKILFIAKEHNYLGTSDQEDYKSDYRVWWNHHVRFQFSHRISEWACGILNDFKIDYKQLTYEQKHEALRSIAFINVKKTSGNSAADSRVICDYIIQSQELLHHQIKKISPTIIICCLRHNYYVEHLFDTKLKTDVSNAFSYGKWNNVNIINFYHPSSRKNKQLLYRLMEEAMMRVKTEQIRIH